MTGVMLGRILTVLLVVIVAHVGLYVTLVPPLIRHFVLPNSVLLHAPIFCCFSLDVFSVCTSFVGMAIIVDSCLLSPFRFSSLFYGAIQCNCVFSQKCGGRVRGGECKAQVAFKYIAVRESY